MFTGKCSGIMESPPQFQQIADTGSWELCGGSAVGKGNWKLPVLSNTTHMHHQSPPPMVR